MWSYDRTVQIEKPSVEVLWRSIGFYALTGRSVITYKERLVKETIVEALEEIREQNPVGTFNQSIASVKVASTWSISTMMFELSWLGCVLFPWIGI